MDLLGLYFEFKKKKKKKKLIIHNVKQIDVQKPFI